MKRHSLRFLLLTLTVVIIITASCSPSNPGYEGSKEDREAVKKTGEAIRDAFARGNVENIMAYQHPDVIRAITATKYFVGSEAVKNDLLKAVQDYNLHYDESHIENTFIQGDTAVEESTFAFKGIPRSGGQPWLSKGRSMVVYVRYQQSPTGWALIREIIQPMP